MVQSLSFAALRRFTSVAWLVGISAAAVTVHAQPTARASRPDPLDPKASVPPLIYESPFKSYTPLGADKPVSWREANDTVNRIGGWRVYAREAQQPDAETAAKPRPAVAPAETSNPMPMPPNHGGHGGNKTP